ncbi:hypothetical protein LI82_07575 [Methanococcoides methylutens]|uniref:UPF0305 protein LI82_07575 n=1 Tax=Methanococcoides methylutens TaxID=2226 RepID=A0A099T0M7_METMT|nr:DUF2115 domain-containing protein [Methanococcoides methylutens]KGK98697.1 hypothetical protein LI82_07575 [Methanococcoides methylutens]
MNTADLLSSLQKSARSIPISDIMKARAFMVRSASGLPKKYREAYSTELFNYLYTIFTEISNSKQPEMNETIDAEEYEDLMKRLEQMGVPEDKNQKYFNQLVNLTAPYLVFIVKKPIHPIGMVFPGGDQVLEKDGIYYCPVKDKQNNVECALCKFCICRDAEEMVKGDKWKMEV